MPKILSGSLGKKNSTDAGWDISCSEDFVIKAGESFAVPTNLKVAIPVGMFGKIASRSGLAFKHGIEVGAGIIDSGYRGEVKVLLRNFGKEDVSFIKGSRIAQLILMPFCMLNFTAVEVLDETERGTDGFGSTGVEEVL